MSYRQPKWAVARSCFFYIYNIGLATVHMLKLLVYPHFDNLKIECKLKLFLFTFDLTIFRSTCGPLYIES